MVTIKIPLSKASTYATPQYGTIFFPTLNDITDDKTALLKGAFYLFIYKSGSYHADKPYRLGKVGEITSDITFNDLSEINSDLTTDTNTATAYALAFKFDDDNYNNEEYDEYLSYVLTTLSNGSTSTKALYWSTFDTISGYFVPLNSAGTGISTTNHLYTIGNITGVSFGDSEPVDPDPEPDPDEQEKTITLSLNDGVYSWMVKSPIEIFYSTDDNNIISLGYSTEKRVFSVTIPESKYCSFYYKYVNAEVNPTKCVNCFQLQNLGSYGVYNADKDLFELGIITSDDILNERIVINPPLELNLVNCTCNITEVNRTVDTEIIITAKEKYFFSVVPVISIHRTSNPLVRELTLNEDRTIATYTIIAETQGGNYPESITATAERETVITDKYGLITIYKPTTDILKELPAKTLIVESYTVNNGIQANLLDLSKNIIEVLSIPLNIEAIDSKEITLQSKETGLTSEYINDNIQVLDFGNIEIKGIYNNSLDYKNTKLYIYLPFIGVQSLDVNKYMDKFLNLSYVVDLFSGDFLAELKVNNIIIDTFSGNLAIKVPYITASEKSLNIASYSMLDKNNLLTDREAKIIIESNDINNNVMHSTLEYKELNKLSGFNIVDDVKLIDNYLSLEDETQIKNKLKQGVIF